MRLIDADALLDTFGDTKYDVSQMYGDDGYSYEAVSKLIESAPTIEPKKGEWITRQGVYGVVYCSNCGFELHINDTNFCPNCGAKMDEEQT